MKSSRPIKKDAVLEAAHSCPEQAIVVDLESRRSRRQSPRHNEGDNAVSDGIVTDSEHEKYHYHFDRHTPEYRFQFEKITAGAAAEVPGGVV